jgi:hypothetical protein
MASGPCDWAAGTAFWTQCEAEHLDLNYAALALEVLRAAVHACLAVAVVRAWKLLCHNLQLGCRRQRHGEARTRRRRTVQAASSQTDPSIAADEPWPAMSRSDPSIALATATSHRALSKSRDSPMVPARTRQGHPVTPPRDARKEGSQMRPARAAVAKNTPAKPGRQLSFSQSDQTMTPAARRLPVIDENDEFAQHSTQSRSDLSIALATAISHREGSQMRPARAAAENKNITGSSSAPKKKLSSGALFLAEMVRRRMVSETGEPNVT